MVTKDRPRLRQALRELATSSSLHGLPKVFESKTTHMKVIWLVLFLATLGYVTYQLIQLFGAYYDRPIKTAVTLKFNPLPFPAVSFCNMNPIKRSLVNFTSDDIKAIVVPGEILTEDDPNFDDSITLPTLEASGAGDMDNYNYQDNSENSPASEYDYFNLNNFNYGSMLNDLGTLPDLDYSLIKDLLAFDDIGAPREEWISRIEAFRDAFMDEPRQTRYKIGHLLEDMLVSCSYNARKCFADDFKLFQSSEYGNCFTLESSKYFATKPGPLNGLWLTLNLEIFEYITSFATGYGIKLLIHPPGTVVFPTVEGIVLSPGQETSVALRMVNVLDALSFKVNVYRLRPPYGECTNGEEFQKNFGILYTIPACVKLCKHHWVIKKCQCVPQLDIEIVMDEESNEDYYLYDYGHPACDSKDLEQKSCTKRQSLDVHGQMIFTCTRNNFLRVVVYYEDINYEVISESPLYDEFTFLSNIGGTLGLFLGASVISVVEIVQLLVETVIYVKRRFNHRQQIKDSMKTPVKPIDIGVEEACQEGDKGEEDKCDNNVTKF
ncbi:amiloride-sensitive sodium channel subunit alpha-like [Argopecten irradians]|uniref:amiloride-sensitive sodium channel subunit alpha-like n=1 Tax=Argopecten irradians TaxID=31199 RepID=UPI003722150A